MEKKMWNDPEFLELGVESTECWINWNYGHKDNHDWECHSGQTDKKRCK